MEGSMAQVQPRPITRSIGQTQPSPSKCVKESGRYTSGTCRRPREIPSISISESLRSTSVQLHCIHGESLRDCLAWHASRMYVLVRITC